MQKVRNGHFVLRVSGQRTDPLSDSAPSSIRRVLLAVGLGSLRLEDVYGLQRSGGVPSHLFSSLPLWPILAGIDTPRRLSR